MIKKLLLIAATAALAVSAAAQGFRGGAGMFRSLQAGPMASASLLSREDVQAELKITEDQKGKLDAIRSGVRERMRSAFADMRNAAAGSPEDAQKAMQVRMQGLFEDMAKGALAVLDDAQKARVKELAIQSQGALAILQPDVAKELSITAAQKVKIDDLQRMQDEANAGLFERLQNQEIDRDQLGASMQKNRSIMDAEVVKLLTEPQRTKLKAMGGTPFEFKDPKPGTPGSFGRPGG